MLLFIAVGTFKHRILSDNSFEKANTNGSECRNAASNNGTCQVNKWMKEMTRTEIILST